LGNVVSSGSFHRCGYIQVGIFIGHRDGLPYSVPARNSDANAYASRHLRYGPRHLPPFQPAPCRSCLTILRLPFFGPVLPDDELTLTHDASVECPLGSVRGEPLAELQYVDNPASLPEGILVETMPVPAAHNFREGVRDILVMGPLSRALKSDPGEAGEGSACRVANAIPRKVYSIFSSLNRGSSFGPFWDRGSRPKWGK